MCSMALAVAKEIHTFDCDAADTKERVQVHDVEMGNVYSTIVSRLCQLGRRSLRNREGERTNWLRQNNYRGF